MKKRIKFIFTALFGAVLFLLASTILKRVIAIGLCGVLGANSPGCYWFGQSRVMAQVDIFSNPNSGNSQGEVDIFRNDGGGNPGDSGVDIFDNPDVNQHNQSVTDNDLWNGIWFYTIYNSVEGNNPVYRIPIKVEQQSDKLFVTECQFECDDLVIPQSYLEIKIPQEEATVISYRHLNIETIESIDRKAIWGRIYNENNTNEIYFSIEKIYSESELNSLSTYDYDVYHSSDLNKQSNQEKNNNKCIRGANSLVSTLRKKGAELTERFIRGQQQAQKLSMEGGEKLVTQKISMDEFIKKRIIDQILLNPFSQKSQIKQACLKLPNLGRLALRGGVIVAQAALIATTAAVGEWCLKNPEGCRILANNPEATARAIANYLRDQFTEDEAQQPVQITANQSNNFSSKRQGNQRKGRSYGDPHLITYDGYRYSFQTVGEFILSKSIGGDFEVQTRQAAVPGRNLSLNTAAAMKVGNDRVAFYTKFFPDSHTDKILRVNGQVTEISGGTLSLPGGGKISKSGNSNYLVQWQNGEQVAISLTSVGGAQYMNVTPYVLDTPIEQFVGLLGNLNNDPSDDLKTRNGNVIPSRSTYGDIKNIVTKVVPIPGVIPLNSVENAVFDQIYKDFGNSWRVTPQESLFDYASDQTTETFTNKSFPSRYRTINMLSTQQIREAEATCLEAGVEPDLLEGCIFDVGFTGDASFANAAANTLDIIEQFVPGGVPRPNLPVNIPRLPF